MRLHERDADDKTGEAVIHLGVALIHWWLRLSERCRQGISFELDPASFTELAINPWQERTVVHLNDTRHLQQLGGSSAAAGCP